MKTKSEVKTIRWVLGLLLVLSAYVLWSLLRPLPSIQPSFKPTVEVKTPSSNLNWPLKGQAAVSLIGSSILETHGAQTPSPMASTAKVITALMVLQNKPLAKGQTGPLVTMTPADVTLYSRYLAQDGSVLPVSAGEQINEYQMLQALMLPSANNIADTMAIWAYGSLPAYASAANTYLLSQGIKHTHVGSDASGLNPDTVTTAEDLVAIGKLAMKHTVLSEIVSQSSATGLPLAPVIKNVNFLLGKDGIVGIKTGNSDSAGGVFLGAAKVASITVITAVVGAPDLSSAMQSSRSLIQSSEENFTTTTVLAKEAVVGTYSAPWGEKHSALVKQAILANSWRGEKVSAKVELGEIKMGETQAGSVEVQKTASQAKASYVVSLDKSFSMPSLWWRITHPLY